MYFFSFSSPYVGSRDFCLGQQLMHLTFHFLFSLLTFSFVIFFYLFSFVYFSFYCGHGWRNTAQHNKRRGQSCIYGNEWFYGYGWNMEHALDTFQRIRQTTVFFLCRDYCSCCDSSPPPGGTVGDWRLAPGVASAGAGAAR